MKNILNTTKILLAAAAGVLIASCTKNFEDYNTKPYRPTYVNPPQLLMPMMRNIISTQENDSQMIDQMIGMEYGGYTSVNNNWKGEGAFATYNPRMSWWGSMYGTLFQKTYGNWAIIRDNTNATGPLYQMAQILRVAAMIKVTDTYGPIPYSKVNGQDVLVAYDKQEDVYLAMIQDLTAAADGITSHLSAGGKDDLMKGFDASSYNGDMTKWVKYANSLRLRLAIRMSKTNQAAKAQEVAEAAIAHVGGVITSNADNLYITPESKNPYTVSGINGGWNELAINASIVSYMNGYEDPRRDDYFTKVNGAFVGLRSGINQSDPSRYATKVSFFALENGTSTPLLAMCAAEVSFLKAEGALMGWNMGGDVETLYNQGITLSFEQHKATNASAYYNNSTLTPGGHTDPVNSSLSSTPTSTIKIKWDNAATPEEKLERLMVQKWIAMFPYGFEAWADIRRTGYPKLFQTAENLSGGAINSNRGMRRVPFSNDEYTRNKANVEAAVGLLGGPDNGATDLWWAKKN